MRKQNKTKEQIKAMLFQAGANLEGMIDKEQDKEKKHDLCLQKGMINMIYMLVDGEFYKEYCK